MAESCQHSLGWFGSSFWSSERKRWRERESLFTRFRLKRINSEITFDSPGEFLLHSWWWCFKMIIFSIHFFLWIRGEKDHHHHNHWKSSCDDDYVRWFRVAWWSSFSSWLELNRQSKEKMNQLRYEIQVYSWIEFWIQIIMMFVVAVEDLFKQILMIVMLCPSWKMIIRQSTWLSLSSGRVTKWPDLKSLQFILTQQVPSVIRLLIEWDDIRTSCGLSVVPHMIIHSSSH